MDLTKSIKGGFFIFAYYLFLTVVVFLRLRPGVVLPATERFLYLTLIIILPILYNKIEILPAAFLLFCGIDRASFTAIFPSNDNVTLVFIVFCYFLYKDKTRFVLKCFLIFAYYVICSLVHFDFQPKLMIWFPAAVLLCDMIKNKEDLKLLFFAFLALSIFLDVEFLVHRGAFLVNYGREDLERAIWINPNVYGAEIAAGGVLAFAYLMDFFRFEKTKALNIICIFTLFLSVIVLIMNASRGSILALVVPVVFMVIMSKTKLYIKILVVTLGILFVVVLYNQGVFSLLFYRIESAETEGAGGRLGIWQSKLSAFLSSDKGFVFGIGQEACANLGVFISTHNDFITALIAYGIAGFMVFVYTFFIYPIVNAPRQLKLMVMALSLYLVFECSVLEPIFRGYFSEIMFFFFIIKYIMIMKREIAHSNEQ